MGKRIEDLRKLDDTPIERQVEALDKRAREFITAIDDLVETGEYDWAVDTLNGIRETVLKSQRVTEGQQRAVDNIEHSKASRRYEGYRGRGR